MKSEYLGLKPLGTKEKNQPTYDAEYGNRTRATLVGGGCSHHCVIPDPLFKITSCIILNRVLDNVSPWFSSNSLLTPHLMFDHYFLLVTGGSFQSHSLYIHLTLKCI